MKVVLSLSVFGITLALCQAACFREGPAMKDGELIPGCIDPYDGTKYPYGSEWNTEHCYRCECNGGGMECCTRYGGILMPPAGCEVYVNPETCQYESYYTDNPFKPCS
ncbi:prostate-associated microseminoprotein [Paroedura picta]|uniref:prostate-associated microseminoprotein n=1 Tax=Paroedura picta TaxID=143630 RepID=UPI0040562ABE